MPILYIYPKVGEPTTYPLGEARVTIGRAGANDIVLSDQFSSGLHAIIAPTERGYALVDQGSKNGTYRNGRRVTGEIDLARGDEILIGSTRFYFDKDFQPAVETVEGTTFTHSSNTIIQVKDILRKPPSSGGVVKTPGGGLDIERLQQDQKFISVLSAVSQALIYHMPLEKLLDHIMDVLIQHLPMDRGVLMIRNEESQTLEPRVVRVQNGALRAQSIFVSQTIVRTALERNSAILISDIQADEGLREQMSVVQAQIHSAMCVPLWNNQTIIGLLYCDRASLLEQFTEDDLRLLTLLANLAAVKIENARLYEESLKAVQLQREIDLAVQIQKNFLPRDDPAFAPYEISGTAQACRRVGGDYYDYISIDPDRLAIVVADVSGVGAYGLAAGGPAREVPGDHRPGRLGHEAQRFRLRQLGQPPFHLVLSGHYRSALQRDGLYQRRPQPAAPPGPPRGRPAPRQHGRLPGHVPRPALRRGKGPSPPGRRPLPLHRRDRREPA